METPQIETRACPIGSEYTLSNKILRALWAATYLTFIRFSPRPLHSWRRLIYMIFGARLGRGTRIYPKATVWAPWNLQCGTQVAVADGVEIYNPVAVSIGDQAVISQGAYLCCAGHDVDDQNFPLILGRIVIEAKAWIAAKAVVMPGVVVGQGAVLALGSIATRNCEAWWIYAGTPAKKIRERKHNDA